MTNDLYGENPDPVDERFERALAERVYFSRPHPIDVDSSVNQDLMKLREKFHQEDLAITHTAGLFLNEVKAYCDSIGVNSDDIPLEKKVEFLLKYNGFTGIENPNYSEDASGEMIYHTFRHKRLEARALF